MNQVDAYRILASELAQYRLLRYADLAQLVGPSKARQVRGDDSTEYSIEVKVRWRTGEPGEILVEGWIAQDDCGPMQRLDDGYVMPPA